MSHETINFGDGQVVTIPNGKLRPGTKLYIAGPQGFQEATRPFHNKVVRVVKRMGGIPLDPWKLTPAEKIQAAAGLPLSPAKVDAWQKLNHEIGHNNHLAIEKSDGVLAILDGTDVDSGTASEIAAGCILGKRVVGYRGDFRLAGDNIGCLVNLQVEYYIRRSGGNVFTTITKLPEELLKHWSR